jgi:hypothetical protein
MKSLAKGDPNIEGESDDLADGIIGVDEYTVIVPQRRYFCRGISLANSSFGMTSGVTIF